MESNHWTGDDTREQVCTLAQDCDCPECRLWNESHCETCRAPLEKAPYGPGYALCGDCHGGREPDGEVFRGVEAAAYEREQMAHIQRTLK